MYISDCLKSEGKHFRTPLHYIKEQPLLLGICTKDFESQAVNELTLKKGQEVYIYEYPLFQWVFASLDPSGPAGYVPSDCLLIKYLKTAISFVTKIGVDDYLTLKQGEFLIVLSEDREKNVAKCRNLNGNEGIVCLDDIKTE